MLISIDQLKTSEKRFDYLPEGAARDNPQNISDEVLVANVAKNITTSNIIGSDENLVKRKEMLEAVNQEPVDFAFERAIGKNDSVYSNFVDLIENAKQKVGRIHVKHGAKNIGFATGFMVAENLLLTNWHVFKTIEEVGDSEVQFMYEYDLFGKEKTHTDFNLMSSTFFYSNKELDYCFVAVSPIDTSGKVKLSDFGYIFLDPGLGKLGDEEVERLNIIHHPDGDLKQLSIRENLFKKITPISIWYETDTAPGSSGSPVFNDQWQVVALHHMGVGKKNDAGQYIDKDGNVIPEVNNKIDPSKIVWEANEGIRISVILKDLFSKFGNEPIVEGLKKNPQKSDLVLELNPAPKIIVPPNNNNPEKIENMEPNNPTNSVNISFPASLVEKNGIVNISINQGIHCSEAILVNSGGKGSTNLEISEEIKKLEESTDFSTCKGYQSRFMGSKFDIPLPQPQTSIKKFIAKVANTDSMVLKYFNYSTIFHTVRMMPVISGINVDGDPAKRKDNSTRKDVWLRDTRIGFDIQLDDTYYKGSGFDRGHMSRREDANWGATPEDAKRNADLTCMYTNACPQVAKINQSGRKGLWGILEKVVLESGAEAENGKTAKISVFNGPIFKADDPVFRGIQVPMDFYKIVLWLTDSGNLKATAFKLSQIKLVSDIDFEQLDIDQNTEFKEFQCSIKSLQEDTKIDFSSIIPFDTFDGSKTNEIALTSQSDLVAHIHKNSK